MAFVTPQQIYDLTDGGLNVILDLYPQAREIVGTKKKFRIRSTDKTASASLKKKAPEGIWLVTDFGGDQVPRNCVELVRLEQKLEYKDAIQYIANRYNIIPVEQQKEVIKSLFTKRDATAEEKEGDYFFDVKDAPSEFELLDLYSTKVVEYYKFNFKDKWQVELSKSAASLNFFWLKSFTIIKDRKAYITASTDQYPIILVDRQDFKKVYQPRNPDKEFKFRYFGEFPKDYIHGYDRLIKDHEKLVQEWLKSDKRGDDEKEPKLDHAMICSGEGDSANAHALGYRVLWQNSESAKAFLNSPKTMGQLKKRCNHIYNVPDLDATGKRKGHELAMAYLFIQTVWLPESLKKHNDRRGNPCKDLRDYLNWFSKKSFDKLVETALPYEFWEEDPQFTRSGDFKKMSYRPSNTKIYNFLMRNGFHRFKSPNEKEGYFYIQITDNIVARRYPYEFRTYINRFLEERHMQLELRDAMYRTTQLGDASLSNLAEIDIDFTDYDKTSQYMFFVNKTWRITKAGIEEFKPEDIQKYVWDEELIKHRVEKKPPPFTINPYKDASGQTQYDIVINNLDCLCLRYLINASRIHWRKELEDSWAPEQEAERLAYCEANKWNIAGPRLSTEEINEQKRHLVNKLYSLGYLMHGYKDPSRPWCVFAMDAKVSEDGLSHGRSGKSLGYKGLLEIKKHWVLSGRNPKITDNLHIYGSINEHTDIVLVDDGDQYLKFNFFFDVLTGDMPVNPKNNKEFIIPFDKAPKFVITSNYTLRNIDASTKGRILYTVFGDYYHENLDNEYRQIRSVRDDFGKNLFFDFTADEWNSYLNTLAYSCSMYMNFEKIEPPLDNVNKRNLLTEMTELFKDWADLYFSEGTNRLNRFVSREDATHDFKEVTGQGKHWTPQRFTKSLKAWCRWYGYELNPKEFHNARERIVKQVETEIRDKSGAVIGTKEKSTEMIFIRTTESVPVAVNVSPPKKSKYD